MTEPTSSLYVGHVSHRRLKPKKHYLRYGLFLMSLDLGDTAGLDGRLRLFSFGRFNLFSLREADYGPPGEGSLSDRIGRYLASQGLDLGGGRLTLMTMPRILGYAFNPLSIFLSRRPDGTIASIVYEVHNTFGEKHFYAFAAQEEGKALRQSCAKQFYVSPFLDMDMRYDFHMRPPTDEFALSILDSDRDGLVLSATMTLERRDLTDAALLRLFVTFPLMTLKVFAGIHVEALLLWLKGVKLVEKPKVDHKQDGSDAPRPAFGHSLKK